MKDTLCEEEEKRNTGRVNNWLHLISDKYHIIWCEPETVLSLENPLIQIAGKFITWAFSSTLSSKEQRRSIMLGRIDLPFSPLERSAGNCSRQWIRKNGRTILVAPKMEVFYSNFMRSLEVFQSLYGTLMFLFALPFVFNLLWSYPSRAARECTILLERNFYHRILYYFEHNHYCLYVPNATNNICSMCSKTILSSKQINWKMKTVFLIVMMERDLQINWESYKFEDWSQDIIHM